MLAGSAAGGSWPLCLPNFPRAARLPLSCCWGVASCSRSCAYQNWHTAQCCKACGSAAKTRTHPSPIRALSLLAFPLPPRSAYLNKPENFPLTSTTAPDDAKVGQGWFQAPTCKRLLGAAATRCRPLLCLQAVQRCRWAKVLP